MPPTPLAKKIAQQQLGDFIDNNNLDDHAL